MKASRLIRTYVHMGVTAEMAGKCHAVGVATPVVSMLQHYRPGGHEAPPRSVEQAAKAVEGGE